MTEFDQLVIPTTQEEESAHTRDSSSQPAETNERFTQNSICERNTQYLIVAKILYSGHTIASLFRRSTDCYRGGRDLVRAFLLTSIRDVHRNGGNSTNEHPKQGCPYSPEGCMFVKV